MHNDLSKFENKCLQRSTIFCELIENLNWSAFKREPLSNFNSFEDRIQLFNCRNVCPDCWILKDRGCICNQRPQNVHLNTNVFLYMHHKGPLTFQKTRHEILQYRYKIKNSFERSLFSFKEDSNLLLLFQKKTASFLLLPWSYCYFLFMVRIWTVNKYWNWFGTCVSKYSPSCEYSSRIWRNYKSNSISIEYSKK